MTKYGFADQAGRLSRARSALMAPHRDGEEKSFIEAVIQCKQAFKHFDVTRVENEDARGWIETIKRFTDKTSAQGSHEGLVQYIRAMDLEEKCEFSNAVDELASWFDGKSWPETES
jgi:hypothetical protein